MTELRITIPGPMRGKGRPRFGNGRTFTDTKTEAMEAVVRMFATQQVGTPVLDGAIGLRIMLDVEVPTSWSRTKRAGALSGVIRPTGRPDLDNVAKLIADSLNKIVWRDDAQITELAVSRRYAEQAQTEIVVRAL